MYILSFLFTLHISISAYVNSTFLTEFISEKYVGLIYTAGSLITLILLAKSSGILKRLGNRGLVMWLLVINMIALTGLITSVDPRVIAVSFISFITTNVLTLFSIDIFIEHFGDPKTIGKTRGLYLTIISLAWMVSPLITALLIGSGDGYLAIYAIAFFVTALTTIGLSLSVRKFRDKSYRKTPFLETYRYLKTNKHMLAITLINFILQFFFVWMVVYTPIYLIEHLGFTWDQIGVVFTIMLAPFVIFGLPVGILIDKYHVKKRTLLAIGFVIMSISTLSIAYISTTSVALWALVLFTTRVGASIVEATSEIYFFTHVREEDAYLLGVFRDMTPVAYMVAPLLGSLVFIFLPFKSLFTILAIFVLAGLYYVTKLKHSHGPELIPNTNK
jgi:MFS family permease